MPLIKFSIWVLSMVRGLLPSAVSSVSWSSSSFGAALMFNLVFANLLLLVTVVAGLVAIRYFKPRSKGSPLAAGGKAFAFQVSESRFVDFDGSVFDFSTGVHSAFEPRSKGSPLAAGGRP